MGSANTSIQKTVQPSPPPVRKDLAWRHATEADLERIHSTIDLNRWRDPRDLNCREARALRFFCALHRCGRVGYVGTRASYGAIGAAMVRVMHEPASRATVIRAVNGLIAKGYIERARGYGDRVREVAPGEFARELRAVLTLTEKARGIWSLSHTSSPVSKSNGYDLPSPLPPSQEKGGERPERSVYDASPAASAAPNVSNEESRADDVQPRGRPAPASPEPRQSARPVAPLATLADGDAFEETSQAACQRERARFLSGTRPTSRGRAVAALLATLTSLTRFAGREGRAVCARAAAEMAGRSDAAPSGVDWGYWIARWPEMVRGERFRWARAEILPLLRTAGKSTAARVPEIGERRSARNPSNGAAPPPPRKNTGSAPSATSSPPEPESPPRAAFFALPPIPEPAAIAEGNPYAATLSRVLARLGEK